MLNLARLVDSPRARVDVRATEVAKLRSGAGQTASEVLNAFITQTFPGVRAISMPIGRGQDGMPIEVQPAAARGRQELLRGIASAVASRVPAA